MEQKTFLRCPECEDTKVLVYEETSFDVNTMEFYCTSVKAHDNDAKTQCLDCGWTGERYQLIEK